MKKYILPIILAIGCSEAAVDKPLIETEAEIVNMSTSRLSYVDSMMNKYIKDKKLPGGVALIARGGNIIHHKAYGVKNIAQNIPQEVNDLFRIASMTKAITAVSAMTLLEQGKFQLEDPLWWFIPEFKNAVILDAVNATDTSFTSHPAQKEIKIKHLFNHTSGIPYAFDSPDDDRFHRLFAKHGITEGFEERDISLKENVKRLAQIPLLHEPGERWTYGLSYDILGRLIEVISGMSLDQYFQQKIFDPLDMNDTHFYLPVEKYSRLSEVYMSSDGGVVPTDYTLTAYPVQGAKKYLSGGADLSTTALDYAKFAQMVLNGGKYNGHRILSSKTIEWMTKGQINAGKNGIGWGFGVVGSDKKHETHAMPGACHWGGFFSTMCLMDPEEDIVAILLLQMYPTWEWGVHTRFENIIYGAIED